MPKGKILMGKKTPVPMPKAKSGKPAPKGGMVIEKKIPTPMRENKARPYATASIPPRPEGVLKQAIPSYLRKPKKVIARRGGK